MYTFWITSFIDSFLISTFTSHPFKRCLVMHLFFTNQTVLALTVWILPDPLGGHCGFLPHGHHSHGVKKTAAACDAKWPSSWPSSQNILGFLVKHFYSIGNLGVDFCLDPWSKVVKWLSFCVLWTVLDLPCLKREACEIWQMFLLFIFGLARGY